MPFRQIALASSIVLGLAACSSPDEVSEELGVAEHEAGTASASASASGAASAVKEENDLYSFAYSYPAEAGRIPELAAMLDERRESAKAALESQASDDREQAQANDYPYRPHSYSQEWKVVADTPGYLSLSGAFSTYSGGAHGMYGLESLVWDKQAGEAMDGAAMFRSASALDDALGDKLCEALNAQRAERRGAPVPAVPDGDDSGFDSCQHVKDATVLVGSAGGEAFDRIGIWFGPYVAGPYAEGAYELDFPVDAAVVAAVKPEYRAAFAAR
ncbi:DUF4163 domain-containing protein [Pelagerythrobacter marensis]|uniref:DUF4163 domain-containing protein n=1 Tax=Pelagerythrobacter marensis TaxID=543877 RepID=A0ABZ2D2P1_9SPHN